MADESVEKQSPGLATGNVPSPRPTPKLDPEQAGIAQLSNGLTFTEIGQSGLRAFAGYIREEFLPNLQGRQGARSYREMADNSPTIGGILWAITASMRKVDWRVLPRDEAGAQENEERIEFVESIMNDMSATWEETVSENLSMLTYGYAPHEIIYKRRLGRTPGADPTNPGQELPGSQYDDGLIGWRRLPIRGQDTVLKWFFDLNGQPIGLTQQPYIGALVDIPIQKMLLFRPSAMKGNPEGRSIIRNAWTSYNYIKRLQEQEAITYERFGGFPVARVPSQVVTNAAAGNAEAQAVLTNMKRLVTNIRIDEQMGAILPSDCFEGANGPTPGAYKYDLEFKTPAAGRSSMSPHETINRYSVNMMISVLADFLQMGHEVRGTQGLSTNKVDMFFLAIEGFLNANASVYNRYALPRLWGLNGWDEADMPKLVPDLAQRIDLDVLSNYVMRLAQVGMPMFPNEELQSYLMDAAGLPDVTDPDALEFAGMTPELIAAATDATLNPPDPMADPNAPPIRNDGIAKILRAALAKRIIRMGGPRFGVSTTRKRTKRHKHRKERIEEYER